MIHLIIGQLFESFAGMEDFMSFLFQCLVKTKRRLLLSTRVKEGSYWEVERYWYSKTAMVFGGSF
jgi:hypothetical protein